MYVENIKKKVSSNTLSYLIYKFSSSTSRNKHLHTTQQQHERTTEKIKNRHKNRAKTFGKSKHVAIKKVQCIACGCAVQVTSQRLIEQAIKKENSN